MIIFQMGFYDKLSSFIIIFLVVFVGMGGRVEDGIYFASFLVLPPLCVVEKLPELIQHQNIVMTSNQDNGSRLILFLFV